MHASPIDAHTGITIIVGPVHTPEVHVSPVQQSDAALQYTPGPRHVPTSGIGTNVASAGAS
jgi:hypothetical protein